MSQLEADPGLRVECRYVVSTNPLYQPQLGMSAERGYVRVRQPADEAIPDAIVEAMG